MSFDSSEITHSPNIEGYQTVGDEFLAIEDKTGDGLKVAIFNENDPEQWVEADPDHAFELEEMR